MSSERDVATVLDRSEKQTRSQSWTEREKSCVVKCRVVCGEGSQEVGASGVARGHQVVDDRRGEGEERERERNRVGIS